MTSWIGFTSDGIKARHFNGIKDFWIFQRYFFQIFAQTFVCVCWKFKFYLFITFWSSNYGKFTSLWPYYILSWEKVSFMSAQFTRCCFFFHFTTKFDSIYSHSQTQLNGVWRKTEKSPMNFVLLYNLFLLSFFFFIFIRRSKSNCEFWEESTKKNGRIREAVDFNKRS